MSDIPKFTRRDGLSLKYNEDDTELVFYIPEFYFEREFIMVEGDRFSLLGLFNYARFKDGKPIDGLKLFRFPSMFTCIPSNMESIKNVKLTKDSIKEDYRLLKFKKDDTIILSTKVPMLTDNMELFIKMINSGKLPNSIPYNELHELFVENATLNKAKYPVSNQVIGIILSEICRDMNDINKPFRIGNNGENYNRYIGMNIKDIPKITSPFAAVTGENWNESIVAAINDDSYKPSPLERLIFRGNSSI